MKFKTIRKILQKHSAHSLLDFIYPAVFKLGSWVHLKEFRSPCPTTERCWKVSHVQGKVPISFKRHRQS